MGFLEQFRVREQYQYLLRRFRGDSAAGSTGGRVFFVNSTNSNPTNERRAGTWSHPYTTIAQAVLQTQAGRGDVIVCHPQHVETFSDATTFGNNSQDAVSLVGLGYPGFRPVLTFDAASSAIAFRTPDMRMANFKIIMDYGGITPALIQVDSVAQACQIVDCDFFVNSATDYAEEIIRVNTPDDVLIKNCRFYCGDWAAKTDRTCAIKLTGCRRAQVENCYFRGRWEEGAIYLESTSHYDIVINNNKFYCPETHTGAAIKLDDSAAISRVLITNNGGYCGASTPCTVDLQLAYFNNFWTNDLDKSGKLIPSA